MGIYETLKRLYLPFTLTATLPNLGCSDTGAPKAAADPPRLKRHRARSKGLLESLALCHSLAKWP